MLKNSKAYQATKKVFYVNLRSTDAIRQNNPGGNTLRFTWTNITGINNLSRQAKIGVVGFYLLNGVLPFVVLRCPQVKNITYDSAGSFAPIIFINNAMEFVSNPEFYNLTTQNLEMLELIVSNDIDIAQNGVEALLDFYIQLKIYDYDEEDVSSDIMPRYTSKSLSYYPEGLNK